MKPGLEISPEGQAIGKDPRKLAPVDLEALGHERTPALQAIRAKCLDCCGGHPSEVRACTAIACPSWPFRMGTDPWRARREMTEEEKAALRDRLRRTA